VTTAVAEGDLSKKINVEAFGEILDMKETVNSMVDSLRSFSSEVTRCVYNSQGESALTSSESPGKSGPTESSEGKLPFLVSLVLGRISPTVSMSWHPT
jgi:hypothetical protein